MKFLIAILLTSSIFAQNKSNQNSFAIETTSQYYQDVSIASVYGQSVELYDRRLKTKLDIPIAEIKSLKKNGLRPNMFATIFGTAAGAGCGAFAALFAQVMFNSQDNTNEVAVIAWGGSIMLGYKLGSSISKREPKREHKVIGFEEWTLDEKRNYLKSIANQ